jgi:hypothetical protein
MEEGENKPAISPFALSQNPSFHYSIIPMMSEANFVPGFHSPAIDAGRIPMIHVTNHLLLFTFEASFPLFPGSGTDALCCRAQSRGAWGHRRPALPWAIIEL